MMASPSRGSFPHHLVLGPQFLGGCAQANQSELVSLLASRHSFLGAKKRTKLYHQAHWLEKRAPSYRTKEVYPSTCLHLQSRPCDELQGNVCSVQRLGCHQSTSHRGGRVPVFAPSLRCRRRVKDINRQREGTDHRTIHHNRTSRKR